MTKKPVLEYRGLTQKHRLWRWRNYISFLLITVAVGLLWQRSIDWNLYVSTGGADERRKTVLPIAWQVIESAVVGALTAGLVLGISTAIGSVIRWLRDRARTKLG